MLGPPARTKPGEGGADKPNPRSTLSGLPRPSLVPRASIQNPRASLIPSARPSLNQSGIRRLNASSMAVGGQKKDPRDWKDKGFVVTCQKRLMKFFSESGFPYALGPKTLTSPSNKEFFQMFQFLYQRFDPSYKFGAKPEDEILPLLTGLNYPFKITKNSLITPGAPHVWPSLMGALLWMTELLEYSDVVGRHQDDDFGNDEEDKDKWTCTFITQVYGAWLNGDDEEFDRLNGDLINFYESRRQMEISNVENLSNSIEALSKEIEQIENAPSRIDALNRKKEDFLSDISKFKKFAATMQDQKDAVVAAIAEMNGTIEAEQRELEQRLKENQELQTIIDAQDITPADVERMMSAKHSLEQSLQLLCEQRDSIQKDVWTREVEVQKASDSLDRAISMFNATATNLRLVGASAKYPKDIISDSFKLITFAPHAPTADRMLNCSIKQDIKPCLFKLKDHLLEKAKSLHDRYMDTHMELEAICETVDEQRESANAIEAKLQHSIQSYRTNKHSIAEAAKRSQAEVENIRQEAKKMRADVAMMWAQSERAVAGAGETVEEHEKNCAREREAMVQFITETLGALMEHKDNISDTLAALNQRLDDELAACESL